MARSERSVPASLLLRQRLEGAQRQPQDVLPPGQRQVVQFLGPHQHQRAARLGRKSLALLQPCQRLLQHRRHQRHLQLQHMSCIAQRLDLVVQLRERRGQLPGRNRQVRAHDSLPGGRLLDLRQQVGPLGQRLEHGPALLRSQGPGRLQGGLPRRLPGLMRQGRDGLGQLLQQGAAVRLPLPRDGIQHLLEEAVPLGQRHLAQFLGPHQQHRVGCAA
jgi:hypothetical protein